MKDPNLRVVLGFRSASPFIQLYLDKAYSTAIGQALDDAIADQFAGKATPAQVVAQDRGGGEEEVTVGTEKTPWRPARKR